MQLADDLASSACARERWARVRRKARARTGLQIGSRSLVESHAALAQDIRPWNQRVSDLGPPAGASAWKNYAMRPVEMSGSLSTSEFEDRRPRCERAPTVAQ